MIAERGRMAWQNTSGYNLRAKVDGVDRPVQARDRRYRSRTDQTEASEVAIAAAALNRMLGLGRPNYVRID
jgi:GH18 family chitinase